MERGCDQNAEIKKKKTTTKNKTNEDNQTKTHIKTIKLFLSQLCPGQQFLCLIRLYYRFVDLSR